MTGGTALAVKGSGFSFSPNLKCRFGLASVAATFVSSSELACVAPAAPAGAVSLTVSNNGVDFSSTSVAYTFAAVAKVTSVSPKGGFTTGGTVVVVSGTGFVSTTKLACRFGKTAASAVEFVSSTQIKCTAPSSASGEGPVAVEASNNGADFTSDATQFRYQTAASVFSIAPNTGPASGSSAVVVHGFNFVDSDALFCRFGASKSVAARWISATKLECLAPAHVAGVVGVEVTLNNADSTSDGTKFAFVADATVTSVAPTSGSLSGGTVLTVMGSGFVFSSNLKCRTAAFSHAASHFGAQILHRAGVALMATAAFSHAASHFGAQILHRAGVAWLAMALAGRGAALERAARARAQGRRSG
jgi:hypothetical protein